MAPGPITNQRELDAAVLDETARLRAIAAQFRGKKAAALPSREAMQTGMEEARAAAAHFKSRPCRYFIGHPQPPCRKAIAEMEPVGIAELRLDTRHEGRVLFVRAFEEPIRMLAVTNAVEDSSGDVTLLALYNRSATLEPQLPNGAIYAVKEPYFTKSAGGLDEVRVDHASDLIRLHASSSSSVIPKELLALDSLMEQATISSITKAKEFEKNGKLFQAIDAYSEGIAAADPTNRMRNMYLVNRAEAHNDKRVQRYEYALSDAENALIPTIEGKTAANVDITLNTKAYRQAGWAAYWLRDFTTASKAFQDALKLKPQDKDALDGAARTKLRKEEERTGRFNFEAMAASVTFTNNRLDHANFTANVDVRETGTRGKGLFATRAIAAGDVIMVEKAFEVAHSSAFTKAPMEVINIATSQVMSGAGADLLFLLIDKLLHNPKQAAKFFDLWSRDGIRRCKAPVVDDTPTIDIFRVQAILEANTLRLPPTKTTDYALGKVELTSAGIWLMASYLNHACDGNARNAFIGDMIVVRATKSISKGEEILIAYTPPDPVHERAQRNFMDRCGFTCGCAVCAAEAQSPAKQLEQRAFVSAEIDQFLPLHPHPVDQLGSAGQGEKLLRKMKEAFDEEAFQVIPRAGLLAISHWVMNAVIGKRPHSAVRQVAVELLAYAGYRITIAKPDVYVDRTHCMLTTQAVDAAAYASDLSWVIPDRDVSREFRRLAEELWVTLHGSLEGFVEKYHLSAV